MKRTIFPSVALLLGTVAACGGNSMMNNPTCATVTCSNGQVCNATSVMCVNPTMPTPSMSLIIDRMGRPAVNTALTNPFGLAKFNGNAETPNTTKDRYNADGNAADWVANWAGNIKLHLGIYDALDDTCGNQAGYGALGQANYTLLSQVLAGDALQVDTSKTTCAQYLGAELAALGAAVSDCGGRKLDYDVVDVTYSALAVGMTSGVTDGIAQTNAPAATFPFMIAPQ